MKTKKRSLVTPKATKVGAKKSHTKVYVAVLLMAAIAALVGWFMWFYADRALPGVAVGNAQVSNLEPAEIKKAIIAQAPALSITFDDNGQKTTIPAKDLGVVVDVEATLRNVLNARRDGNIAMWEEVNVPLVLANDPGVLIEFAKKKFPTAFVDAKEPMIVFDEPTGNFVVKPGEPGKGLDIKAFQRALPELAKHPENFTLKLTSAAVSPIMDEAKLHEVKTEANDRLDKKVEFKLDNEVIYTASRAEKASWIHFVPDATKGTANIEVDKLAVQKFLTDKVGPTVAAPPIDRKVVVDSATGSQTVIQQGRTGSQIQDIELLSGDVVAAINGNRDLSQGVSITKAPFRTVTMTGEGKWIEVDLSQQRLTIYVGNEAVRSFTVSTGRAATPTSIGESAIYSKRASMTMTGTIAGDYYYLENVKWVNFFNGGEAIHGTYWHNNFGTPMSHGCVNMREADAKIVYDFAPIGTKVIVHQ